MFMTPWNSCGFEEISSSAFPSIFWMVPIPILSQQKFLRKSATKVKNRVFSMVCSSKSNRIQVENVPVALLSKIGCQISTSQSIRRRKLEFLWFPSQTQPYLHSKLVNEATAKISIRNFYFFV